VVLAGHNDLSGVSVFGEVRTVHQVRLALIDRDEVLAPAWPPLVQARK
jgi:hypothetical protein